MSVVYSVSILFIIAYLVGIALIWNFFEHVIRKMNPLLPHEMLFWDDRPDNIEAARQAGIQAEVYTNFVDFQQKMNTFSFFSLQ